MGREFELKFSATPEKLAAIRQEWENWTGISMETTYFDTPESALSAQKCTLRQRMENGKSVCTLKTPVAGLGRGEWEEQAEWSKESVTKLFAAAGREMISFEELAPVCGARFTRLAKMVELSDCTVEIALDKGVLLGGGKEIPLFELEVELKKGTEESAIKWANHFAAQYGLSTETESKFCRASALAKGEQHE